MKIKFAIEGVQTQIKIRSKSRSQNKRLLAQTLPRQNYYVPVVYSSPIKSINENRTKKVREFSCNKAGCEHKRKREKDKQYENQYYKTTFHKRWQQERYELLKENTKLRRQNKVLNDYFSYLEYKENLGGSKQKQKLFSFKELQEELKDIQSTQSKMHRTSITKSNSKMRHFEQLC